MMMAHPYLVKKWAKYLKPAPPVRAIEQARLMRLAKQQKRDFLASQGKLFDQDEFDTKR